MNKTSIQWCDYTSNPIKPEVLRGSQWVRKGWFCTKISAGCQHCYAERMNQRCSEAGAGIGNGLAFTSANEAKVRFVLDEAELQKIIRSRAKPGSRVFVGDMTDLFHAKIPFEHLDAVFAAMALRPDLIFMLLTKRLARTLEYFAGLGPSYPRMKAAFDAIKADSRDPFHIGAMARFRAINATSCAGQSEFGPLPNVQIGATCENQAAADERFETMRQIAAMGWITYVSYEPACGPVDFRPWLRWTCIGCGKTQTDPICACGDHAHGRLSGIIAGGESGPGARPAPPDWFRRIRDDCAAAGVPFFFKTWGDSLDRSAYEQPSGLINATMQAKHGGRLLDGRTHDDLPGDSK